MAILAPPHILSCGGCQGSFRGFHCSLLKLFLLKSRRSTLISLGWLGVHLRAGSQMIPKVVHGGCEAMLKDSGDYFYWVNLSWHVASVIENSDRLHSYQGEVLQRGQNHSGIIHSIARNVQNKAVYFFFLPLPQSTKCSDFCSQESSVWPPVVCSEWPFVSLVWVFLFLMSSSSSRPLTPDTLCIRRALCTQGFYRAPFLAAV